MAVLTDQARAEIWAEFMRELSRDGDPITITKADLRAAFNAIDDFMDANAATINQALPQPARTALTITQKARLLNFVVSRRYIEGA
jgi:hypothetical protein